MKIIFIILFCFLLSCEKQLDSPVSFQQVMLDEVNFIRTDPSGYASLRLQQGKDNGAMNFLKSIKPVGRLSISPVLTHSAADYVLLLNQTLSHFQDETPLKRAQRNGYTGTILGENIAGGVPDRYNALDSPEQAAIEFVRVLVIDEGVIDLGHRQVLLDAKYSTIGVGFNRNPQGFYVNYLVQKFGNK
jgi:uncharacterized protein YkwD